MIMKMIRMVQTNTISSDEAELIQVLTMMVEYLIDASPGISENLSSDETCKTEASE